MGVYSRKLKKGTRWLFKGSYLSVKYGSPAIYLTKAEAKKAERAEIERIDEDIRNPKKQMNLKTLMEKRLDFIQATKSKDYYRENRRYFRKVLKHFGDIDTAELTTEIAQDLLMGEAKRLRNAGKGNFKANSMIRSLKALINWGNKIYDLNIKNPFDKLDFLPININLKYIPPAEDIEAVKSICNSEQRLLIDFVDETACRINEALRFSYHDIEGDLITLWTRKSRNSNLTPRRIPKPDCLGKVWGKARSLIILFCQDFWSGKFRNSIRMFGAGTPYAIAEPQFGQTAV